jgi:prepilin-type N-terminal cleavage/methylation domain-containing protein/prepilin-type processing-associated H-X9-DG protein
MQRKYLTQREKAYRIERVSTLKAWRDTVSTKRGFTLIELLVVIAVIAVLMGILMPALNRARELGKRASCMSNLKNLSLCWVMYADDHDGRLPSGGTDGDTCWVNHEGFDNSIGIAGNVSREQGVLAIKAGVLWPYTKDEGLYRCPTASSVESRTYVMPDSYASRGQHGGLKQLHGAPDSLLNTNRNRIKRAAERMTFLDEGVSSGVTWSIYYAQPRWWDPVPVRHGTGTTIGFADGHVEYWKWSDPRTRDFGEKAMDLDDPDIASFWREIQPDNEDIYRLVKSIWGKVGWE